MIKIDAAQFFKNSSVERGVTRMLDLMQRVEQTIGKNAISISKAQKNKTLSPLIELKVMIPDMLSHLTPYDAYLK